MNDDELITALRAQRVEVPMNTPVEQIVSRGRALRARGRAPRIAVAAGAAGVAAAAVFAALPGGQAPSTPRVQLAAWTVVRQGNGSIKVTIRELRDPAKLQRKLRDDGVPASVTFGGHQNLACHGYPATGSRSIRLHATIKVLRAGDHGLVGPYVFVIKPSALPSGVGVQISALFNGHGRDSKLEAMALALARFEGHGKHSRFHFAEGLVQASRNCTGS